MLAYLSLTAAAVLYTLVTGDFCPLLSLVGGLVLYGMGPGLLKAGPTREGGSPRAGKGGRGSRP